MKKIYFLLLLFPLTSFAATYPGNLNTGFGGAIGAGSLTVTDDGTTISFTLTRGPGDFNDALVIYIDNLQGGGLASTSGLLDNADGLRSATSGYNGNDKTTINFPTGFRPNYALSLAPTQSFAALFQLVNGFSGALGYVGSGNISSNSATSAVYTFSIPVANIGGSGSFRFIGVYTSVSAYLSDEGIGYSLPAGNPGFGATINPATFNTYTSILPLTLLQFNAMIRGNDAQLSWRTAGEAGLDRFVVEQSRDAQSWHDAAAVAAVNAPVGAGYSATVTNVKDCINYYRLRIIAASGEKKYSNIISLKSQSAGAIVLYENPVKNKITFIVNENSGPLHANLYTLNGRLVRSAVISTPGGGGVCSVPTDNAAGGMLILKVITAKGEIYSFRVVKE